MSQVDSVNHVQEMDKSLLEMVHDNAPVASGNIVLIVNQEGTIKSVLDAPPDMVSDSFEEDLTGKSVDSIWPESVVVRIRENIRRAVRSRQFWSEEVREHESGLNAEFIYVAQGPDRILLVARDISEHKSEMSRMQQLAYTDEATSLPNRELFLAETGKVASHQSLREGRFAMICLHLDELEEHRNSFGAAWQDAILKELAGRLTQELRGANSSDVSDYERYSLVARTDFRQFGVVLPSIEGGSDAEAVTLRLVDALEKPIPLGDTTIKVRARGGIALFPQDGNDAATLFENAIAAAEDARNSHQSPFKFHTGTVQLRTLQRQDLELELKTALDREEFAVNYLPIVDANSGKIRSIEALLRWPESILGSQSTRRIVSVAERTGLILPIGQWVLQECCSQLLALQDEGYESLRMSINLSVQEFSRSDMAARIGGTLLNVGVQPADVDLEITEHMLFRDAMKGYEGCKALKGIGVGLVIDDYGTGSCSLTHLAHSPVDALKIDNTLVAQLETSGRDNAACDAAISIAHSLGLEAIAEGVETEEQARLLREQGCDLLQGFHFFEPLSAEELKGFMELSGNTQRLKAKLND